MPKVRDFFGTERHSLPHLGLILKMINHMAEARGFQMPGNIRRDLLLDWVYE